MYTYTSADALAAAADGRRDNWDSHRRATDPPHALPEVRASRHVLSDVATCCREGPGPTRHGNGSVRLPRKLMWSILIQQLSMLGVH